MSCREAFDLGQRLGDVEGLPMGCLFANRMPESLPSSTEPSFAAGSAGVFLQMAWRQQSQAWDRVRGLSQRLDLPLVALREISEPSEVVDQMVGVLQGGA